MVAVSWALQGALLFSLTVALCCAPVVHPRMEPRERAEAAISGYVLFDFLQVLSARREASDRRSGSWYIPPCASVCRECAILRSGGGAFAADAGRPFADSKDCLRRSEYCAIFYTFCNLLCCKEKFRPWASGNLRATELKAEQLFVEDLPDGDQCRTVCEQVYPGQRAKHHAGSVG